MISLNLATKSYFGAERPALDNVNLEIARGEFVFLVGSSGSGKSSLLRVLLREERLDHGSAFVSGEDLSALSNRSIASYRRKLGVIFQDFRLLPFKTVSQNVAYALQVIGKSRAFIDTAVPDVLRLVGLEHKKDSLPTNLSGGEQQRVAIARALVNKPELLLADEPTGNLDPDNSNDVMQLLEKINLSGTTIVMATHDRGIVDRMKRRVVEIQDGRIIRDANSASYKGIADQATQSDSRSSN
jgi:cell division transport system ATP-binding protein